MTNVAATFSHSLRFSLQSAMQPRVLHRISLVLSLLALTPATTAAQDASKLINQHIKAIGGSKSLSKIQTLAFEGTVVRSSDGKTGAFTLETKLPNRFYEEFLLGEHAEILAYNGKSAWRQNSSAEIATLLGPEAIQLESAAQFHNGGLLNLRKNKIGAAFLGHSQVQGRDALEVQLTAPSGPKRELFFDPETHLLVRESAAMPGGREQIDYSDYQPEAAVKIARKLTLTLGSETYEIAATRVTVNGVVGERVFDFPVKSQVRLPDLKKLAEQIDANQKALDKLKESYTGTRDEEETEYDKSGKLTKVEKKRYSFFYLNGEEISTLVAKDGKPLSASEQQKEDENTRKRIDEVQKSETKKEEKEARRKEQGKSDDDKDDPGIETFLRAAQFVNPRRERFRGQDVLVFDFEPNPEYKPRKIEEKLIQKLAGVVWVDENALQVVRLEAHFLSDMRFAGGLLANLQKGSSFVFEQAYLNNEVWLPTYMEAHIGARFLLVKGIKVNVATRYSDYQRFKVETLDTIGKPTTAAPAPEKQP